MSRLSCVVVLSALTLGMTTGRSHAASVTANFGGVNPNQIVNIILDGVHNGPNGVAVYAGVNNWNVTNWSPDTDPALSALYPSSFQAFCIDVRQNVASPTTWDIVDLDLAPQPVAPMGAARAALVEELWGGYRTQVAGGATAAAFQLALWELIHESDANSFNILDGVFRTASFVSATLTATVNAWLNDVLTNNLTPNTNLLALVNQTQQDMLIEGPPPLIPGNDPVTPLPAAAWAGLVGFGILARHRRKRGGKAAA